MSTSAPIDGDVHVRHRPTLTRRALGSVLPGTALTPGLAFQKKETTDTRSVEVIVAHPEWARRVIAKPIARDRVVEATNHINARANELAPPEQEGPSADDGASSPPSSDFAQLREFKAILDEGVKTEVDCERLIPKALGA